MSSELHAADIRKKIVETAGNNSLTQEEIIEVVAMATGLSDAAVEQELRQLLDDQFLHVEDGEICLSWEEALEYVEGDGDE